jgi:hypothetical protein
MFDQLLPIILVIFVVGLIWLLLKLVLKLTAKVFSCGCLVIVVVGLILFALGYIEFPAFLNP